MRLRGSLLALKLSKGNSVDAEQDVVARICPRVAEMNGKPVATAVVDACSRCQQPVYRDSAQPNPYPGLTEFLICVPCGLDDPELREHVIETMIAVQEAARWAGEKDGAAGGNGLS